MMQDIPVDFPSDCVGPDTREAFLHPSIARSSANHAARDYFMRELGYPKLKKFLDGEFQRKRIRLLPGSALLPAGAAYGIARMFRD